MGNNNDTQVEEFISAFESDPLAIGRLVSGLIDKTPRLLINIPLIGIGRKISNRLAADNYTRFFMFERTLTHKLQPRMYKKKLTILVDAHIEAVFFQKFEQYRQMVPGEAATPGTMNPEYVMENLARLRQVMEKMIAGDGHYMVVKYYDLVLMKTNRDLARILKFLEFSVILTRKAIAAGTGDKNDVIDRRLEQLGERFGEGYGDAFTARLCWDPDISGKQAGKASPATGAGRDAPTGPHDRIVRYAGDIRKAYLDARDEHDMSGIRKVVHAAMDSNRKRHGEEKAGEIMEHVMTIWIGDDSLNPGKIKIIRELYNETFGAPVPVQKTAAVPPTPAVPSSGGFSPLEGDFESLFAAEKEKEPSVLNLLNSELFTE